MIIALEGVDGAAKATQSKLLSDRFNAEGTKASVLSFPTYETETGKLLKAILRGDLELHSMATPAGPGHKYCDGQSVQHARALQAIMTLNRYENFERIRSVPYNEVIVLDRYWLSAVAYGISDGLDEKWLIDIHRALPEPDIWFYLDISVEESFKRRPIREDVYESSVSRLNTVRGVYQRHFSSPENRTYHEKSLFVQLDGSLSRQDVHTRIWNTVNELL